MGHSRKSYQNLSFSLQLKGRLISMTFPGPKPQNNHYDQQDRIHNVPDIEPEETGHQELVSIKSHINISVINKNFSKHALP